MMNKFDELVEAIKQRGIQETAYENAKLNHIINELEKWLEETLNELKQNDIYDRTSYEMGQIIATECIIAKIRELKGDVVDE